MLKGKKSLLDFYPPTVASRTAIGADHPVARDEKSYGVAAYGIGHGPV